MTATATNRSLMSAVVNRLFGAPKKEVTSEALVPAPAVYNPLASVSLRDLGMLRRTLSNAAHLADPCDAAILFDHVRDEDYGHARGGQRELSELVLASEQFARNEAIAGVWGFAAHPVRSKITGELGLSISCDVPESTLAQLHALPDYEMLRKSGIPTTVGRFYNHDEAVDNYEYFAQCFVRIDQLSEVAMVKRMLDEIQKGLRATPKTQRRRRVA